MDLLEQIKAAGVVGCGGAGFPTHVKLDCKGRAETLIVNGAECEPLLRTDRWLMRHMARQIVTAATLAGDLVEARRVVIALKESYAFEIDSLTEAIHRLKSRVELFRLKNYYPAGDEQMMVLDVTGKTVPPSGIPLDVGAVVSNVGTMYAIYEAARGGAFTHKYLTVTGAVAAPVVLRVPLGTSFQACLEAAGGVTKASVRILAGGPLMGKLYPLGAADALPVTKTTSGLVAVPEDAPLVRRWDMPLSTLLRQAKTACIQCSACTELCPRQLSGHPLRPHRIMRRLAYAQDLAAVLEEPEIRQAQLCSECGVCETYACPMGLAPRSVNAYLKRELASSRIRYERPAAEWRPAPEREERRAPSRRIAARLGVEQWYGLEIDRLETLEPRRVCLPLKQHIGASAVPLVAVGDTVTCGQPIAACPEGALGAGLAASIDGVVTAVDGGTSGAIIIERGCF